MIFSALWEEAAALMVLTSLVTAVASLFSACRQGRRMMYIAGGTVLLGLIPSHGVTLAGVVLSLSPSLSVAGTCLFLAMLANRLGLGEPLGPSGTLRLAYMVLGAGLVLYVPFIMGAGPDVYGSGYGFSLWDVLLAASAAALFMRGSRLSYVLVFALLAHAAGIMRSSNIFDALVDGPSFIASFFVLAASGLRQRRARRQLFY